MTMHLTEEDRYALAVAIDENPDEAYSRVAGKEWGAGLRWVPDHMRAGLVRYLLFGILPGSFTRAIISNDYFEACRRADDANRTMLFGYAMFFVNYAPGGCYGSAAHMAEWAKQGGMLGQEPEVAA